MGRWVEVAPDVYARRNQELDLTTGLVIGGERCLVVDSRGDLEQGREFASAIRQVTGLPWSLVLTHGHFDHAFGASAFLPCPVWAHDGCLAELNSDGEITRRRWIARYRALGKVQVADALERTVIVMPDRLVVDHATLDLSGRAVTLVHPGPAHTGHDLMVHVPDAGVIFAGDIVEHAESGFTAESFGSDTHLPEWPAALDVLLALDPIVVVPGHGDPVAPAYVRRHRDGLRRLAELKHAVAIGAMTSEAAIAASAYPSDVTHAALATP